MDFVGSTQVVDQELVTVASASVWSTLTASKYDRDTGARCQKVTITARGADIYWYIGSDTTPTANESFKLAEYGILEVNGYDNIKNLRMYQPSGTAGGRAFVLYHV